MTSFLRGIVSNGTVLGDDGWSRDGYGEKGEAWELGRRLIAIVCSLVNSLWQGGSTKVHVIEELTCE